MPLKNTGDSSVIWEHMKTRHVVEGKRVVDLNFKAGDPVPARYFPVLCWTPLIQVDPYINFISELEGGKSLLKQLMTVLFRYTDAPKF